MSEQKTIVISVRLTPAVHAALAERATTHQQPLTRMAALLVEAGLFGQLDERQAYRFVEGLADELASAERVVKRVADLERDLAEWRGRAERAEQAAKVLADHKMITPAQVVNPRGRSVDPDSPKAVATILPITGTEFPRQLTHWQKQQAKPKGKGKP